MFPVMRVTPLESIMAIAHALQMEKFTGKLVVNLSQGAINSVQTEDSRRIESQHPLDTLVG
jgi:hypothetical protein